eukprot:gene12522-13807_t
MCCSVLFRFDGMTNDKALTNPIISEERTLSLDEEKMLAEKDCELTMTADEDKISCGLEHLRGFESEVTLGMEEEFEEDADCYVIAGETDLERTITLCEEGWKESADSSSAIRKLKSGGFEILECKVLEPVSGKVQFDSIFQNTNHNEMKIVCHKKVIVSHEKLIELKGKWCTQCGSPRDFAVKEIGAVWKVSWSCKLNDSHDKGEWASSDILCKKKGNLIYANDIALAAAILISGSNYRKVQLMFDAAHIQLTSCSSYYRIQKTCTKPIITKICDEMHQPMINECGTEPSVLCGDGRNDSPSHSARLCTYILMSQFSDLIVHVEKAKKLNKSIHKIAKLKGCEDLKPWIDPIVNHFWYCCQACDGDATQMASICKQNLEIWIGVLHHVVGEHFWASEACIHGPLTTDDPKTPLSMDSKSMLALHPVILDKKWLQSLPYYVHFRHTSKLENFNSMLCKYVQKRCAYEYAYFIIRTLLAVIDHNMHAD